MILALAQAMPSAEDVAAFFRMLTWIVGFVGTVLGVFVALKNLRSKPAPPPPAPVPLPQPLVVSAHVANVSKPDFDEAMRQAHGRIKREKEERDAEIAEMKAATEALRDKMAADVVGLRKLADNNHAAGEARAGKIQDRLNTLSDQIGDMPGKIVELLSAARGL